MKRRSNAERGRLTLTTTNERDERLADIRTEVTEGVSCDNCHGVGYHPDQSTCWTCDGIGSFIPGEVTVESTDMAHLFAALDAASALRDDSETVMRQVVACWEGVGGGSNPECQFCGAGIDWHHEAGDPERCVHAPDCVVTIARRWLAAREGSSERE